MAVILIVEDEPFTRDLAGMCMDDWGHSPLLADSVESASTILRSHQRIDALFTDINLNGGSADGFDVAREGVGLHPDLRVLYSSGNQLSDQLRSSFVSGAHFLGKPYTPEQLRIGLDALLGA